jgi:splicing factor 3B subunit 5
MSRLSERGKRNLIWLLCFTDHSIMDSSAASFDRFNLQNQLEHFQLKYVGTGHADISKYDWALHHHRDSYASYIAHNHLLDYFSIAHNQPRQRVRFNMLNKMYKPCGNDPNVNVNNSADNSNIDNDKTDVKPKINSHSTNPTAMTD